MKTLTAPIQQERKYQANFKQQPISFQKVSIREIHALLSAAGSAIAIIMLSVWASGLGETAILSAGTWGISFVFMAMAVDNRGPKAIFELFTGLALMILAWLQNTVSPEFIILSGVLLASWVSIGLHRRLR